jgi:serine/threonine protein kinase
VYAAWWRESMVAVKRFNKASDSIHELRMHTAVGTAGNDDCIIPLRGYCRRDNAVYLVMEYCPRCSLQSGLAQPAEWLTMGLLHHDMAPHPADTVRLRQQSCAAEARWTC